MISFANGRGLLERVIGCGRRGHVAIGIVFADVLHIVRWLDLPLLFLGLRPRSRIGVAHEIMIFTIIC